MDVKLRCQSVRGTAQGDKIITERSFVSTDLAGAPLNEGVLQASYSDAQTGDALDDSIALNDVVTITLVPPVA
jgi:hypothetical protein